MGNAVHPEDENHERGGGAGLLAGTGGPSAEPPHLSAFYLDQPQPGLERDYSPSRPPGQFVSSPSATLTVARAGRGRRFRSGPCVPGRSGSAGFSSLPPWSPALSGTSRVSCAITVSCSP